MDYKKLAVEIANGIEAEKDSYPEREKKKVNILRITAFGCASGILSAIAYFVAPIGSWLSTIIFIVLCSGINILGYIHGAESKGK